MSGITVGPIQTYAGDSFLLSPSVNQNPVQEKVSVTLTDTSLWLVDTSKLSGQTGDPRSQFTLLNLQTRDQTTVPFVNINFTAATVAPGISLSSQSSYLQTTLPAGSSLMLAQVTGGTQFDSDGISLLTSGSGSGTRIPATGPPGGSLTPGGGGSGGGSPNPGGNPGSPSSSTPGQSTPGQSTPGQPTGSPQSPTPGSPQPTPFPVNGTPPPGGSSQPPVPVPFDNSPEIGLLLVAALFGYRLLKRSRKSLSQA